MTTTERLSPSVQRVETQPVSVGNRTSAWAAARDFYRERRTARAEYQRVEQELATYRTQADINELDAMLERSAGDVDSVYTQIIERIRLRAA